MKRKYFYIMAQISCMIALYHSDRFSKWAGIFNHWYVKHCEEVGVIDD